MLCGNFNERKALLGKSITKSQGDAIDDSLNKCYFICINNWENTTTPTRNEDSDSVVDLTFATLSLTS